MNTKQHPNIWRNRVKSTISNEVLMVYQPIPELGAEKTVAYLKQNGYPNCEFIDEATVYANPSIYVMAFAMNWWLTLSEKDVTKAQMEVYGHLLDRVTNKDIENMHREIFENVPTEEEVLNTIINNIDIRGIDLEDYRFHLSSEKSNLYQALVTLFRK